MPGMVLGAQGTMVSKVNVVLIFYELQIHGGSRQHAGNFSRRYGGSGKIGEMGN